MCLHIRRARRDYSSVIPFLSWNEIPFHSNLRIETLTGHLVSLQRRVPSFRGCYFQFLDAQTSMKYLNGTLCVASLGMFGSLITLRRMSAARASSKIALASKSVAILKFESIGRRQEFNVFAKKTCRFRPFLQLSPYLLSSSCSTLFFHSLPSSFFLMAIFRALLQFRNSNT